MCCNFLSMSVVGKILLCMWSSVLRTTSVEDDDDDS